ncbi:hypothetical protein DIPPA_09022 [Diplonema papillatum]|nr:hypothetical protein DIPPA_09022 [Diplonema papillatum]
MGIGSVLNAMEKMRCATMDPYTLVNRLLLQMNGGDTFDAADDDNDADDDDLRQAPDMCMV